MPVGEYLEIGRYRILPILMGDYTFLCVKGIEEGEALQEAQGHIWIPHALHRQEMKTGR